MRATGDPEGRVRADGLGDDARGRVGSTGPPAPEGTRGVLLSPCPGGAQRVVSTPHHERPARPTGAPPTSRELRGRDTGAVSTFGGYCPSTEWPLWSRSSPFCD